MPRSCQIRVTRTMILLLLHSRMFRSQVNGSQPLAGRMLNSSRKYDMMFLRWFRKRFRRLEMIPVGFASTWSPNATTVWFPDCTVPIILIDWSLCHYLFCINTFVVSSLPIHRTELMGSSQQCVQAAPLSEREAAHGAILSALQFATGRKSITSLPNRPTATKWLVSRLTRCQERFVLAHEYGHCVLGHEKPAGTILSRREETRRASLDFPLLSWRRTSGHRMW